MASFSGFHCTASASASADCLEDASWPAICVASEPCPEPACVWSIDCFVSLPFAATAPAVAEFDWVTSPSLPGLRTRIDRASLLGATCTAFASASADCAFFASWPATCV